MGLGITFTFEVNDLVSGALDGVKEKFGQAFDNDKTLAKFNAGLGQSAKVTAEMGDLAREVWQDGWGGSLEDVTDALGNVGGQMLDLSKESPDQIKEITKGAMDLAEVMGADVVDVTAAAGNMMKNGLAPNAQAALDIIATGAQNGANRAGDLLDVFNEYGGSFAKAGLDGQTSMMMIKQALDSGAYSADIAADSIREFGTRIMEGGDDAALALQGMDLDLATVQATMAKGGPAAGQMTQDIIYALGEMTDPLAQQQAGTALFGSMWEDAGKKMVLSMETSETEMGNLNGATATMGQTLHDTATQKVDVMKRKFDGWIESMIATKGPAGDIAAFATTFGPQALTLAGNVGMIAAALKGTAIAAGAASFGMGLLSLASSPIAVIAAALLAVIGLIKTAIDQIANLKRNWQGLMSGDMSKVSNLGTFSNLGRQGQNFSLPFMAAGGIVDRPTLAMIGEGNEAEAVIPLSKLAAMQGGGGGDTFVVNVQGSVIAESDLARAVQEAVAKARRMGTIPAGGF